MFLIKALMKNWGEPRYLTADLSATTAERGSAGKFDEDTAWAAVRGAAQHNGLIVTVVPA